MGLRCGAGGTCPVDASGLDESAGFRKGYRHRRIKLAPDLRPVEGPFRALNGPVLKRIGFFRTLAGAFTLGPAESAGPRSEEHAQVDNRNAWKRRKNRADRADDDQQGGNKVQQDLAGHAAAGFFGQAILSRRAEQRRSWILAHRQDK